MKFTKMTITGHLDEKGAEKLVGRIGWHTSLYPLVRPWVVQRH